MPWIDVGLFVVGLVLCVYVLRRLGTWVDNEDRRHHRKDRK